MIGCWLRWHGQSQLHVTDTLKFGPLDLDLSSCIIISNSVGWRVIVGRENELISAQKITIYVAGIHFKMVLVSESHRFGKWAVMLDREHGVVHEIWSTETEEELNRWRCGNCESHKTIH